MWFPGGIHDNRRPGARDGAVAFGVAASRFRMEFRPGDIQLLNNARILHAREACTDSDDPAERRHLLRLRLTAHAFASVGDTLRGGIPARRQDR
jgi:Taurine catabolism dioxygenase TauD, TfdA family